MFSSPAFSGISHRLKIIIINSRYLLFKQNKLVYLIPHWLLQLSTICVLYESRCEKDSRSVVPNSLQPHGLQAGSSVHGAPLVKICLQCGRPGFDPWVAKISWRKEWLPTLAFWPGEFHRLYCVTHEDAKSWTWLSLHYASLLSIGFLRQEHRSGLPFPSPGHLPSLGIKPRSSVLQAGSLPFELPGKPTCMC